MLGKSSSPSRNTRKRRAAMPLLRSRGMGTLLKKMRCLGKLDWSLWIRSLVENKNPGTVSFLRKRKFRLHPWTTHR